MITDFGEWSLVKCGAWTQGPVLAQQLRLLEGFRDQLRYVDGRPDARTVHLATECAKLAFADREAWYGDTDVDLGMLLSWEYAEQRRALVGEEASAELRPGGPNPGDSRRARAYARRSGWNGQLGEPTVDAVRDGPGATPCTSTWSTPKAT